MFWLIRAAKFNLLVKIKLTVFENEKRKQIVSMVSKILKNTQVPIKTQQDVVLRENLGEYMKRTASIKLTLSLN